MHCRTVWTWKAVAATLAAIMFAWPAQAQEARQHKLEAAFLYNFLNYITWPGLNSPAELREATICVVPNDPIKPSLLYVQQKMAAQRTLLIHDWRPGDRTMCHVLFSRQAVASSEYTLTVTDGASLRGDSMIALEQQEGRIAIHIDNSALNRKGFQASSRLLALAAEVK